MWKKKPHKFCQKDVDARWTKKNDVSNCKYKNDAKNNVKMMLIKKYEVTDASVHDSQPVEDLLTEKDEGKPIYAGSAYTGEDQEKIYKKGKGCQ